MCNGSKSSHTRLGSWAGGKEGVLEGNSHHGFNGTPADKEESGFSVGAEPSAEGELQKVS